MFSILSVDFVFVIVNRWSVIVQLRPSI